MKCSRCNSEVTGGSWYKAKEGEGIWCNRCYGNWKWRTNYHNCQDISKERMRVYNEIYRNRIKARVDYLRHIPPEKLIQIVETGEIRV